MVFQTQWSQTLDPSSLVIEAFKDFAHHYGFQYCTSSPHYPQSNGRVKKAIQTIKSLIKKANDDKDIYLALMELQNTPINDQSGSPAQRLMGRRTRTLLPTSNKLLIPKTIKPKIVQSQQQNRQKYYYDQHTKQLPELNKGDRVKIQGSNGKWRSATITKVTNAPRSYIVTTPEGNTYRRTEGTSIKITTKKIATCQMMKTIYMLQIAIQTITPKVLILTIITNLLLNLLPMIRPRKLHLAAPVQRSTRNIRQPLRYTDTWSLLLHLNLIHAMHTHNINNSFGFSSSLEGKM